MIKKFKLFVNNNDKAIKAAQIIQTKLLNEGFIFDNDDYELAIAVGGDGAFLRMVKETNFNSNIFYLIEIGRLL